jgi:CBS domain-containing membrane protein
LNDARLKQPPEARSRPAIKRSLRQSLREFQSDWKHYVFQSLLATAVVFFVLMTLSIDNEAVIIASIGATAFIVFAMPNNVTARPRAIIGGQLAALLCGLTISLVPKPLFVNHVIAVMFWYALAVGLTMFIMVVLDIEHPPAAATAMGVLITGFSWHVVLTVIVSAVLLALIHVIFRRYLKDLT